MSHNGIFVLGEIMKPSLYPLPKGRMNLAEAISSAGGFDETTSDPSRVYVIRGVDNEPVVYRLDASSADALLLASKFDLRSQDVVYVSTSDIARWNRTMQQILPTIQTLYMTQKLVE